MLSFMLHFLISRYVLVEQEHLNSVTLSLSCHVYFEFLHELI